MQHVKQLKFFIYSVNLHWLNLPPVFVHRQDQIKTKIAYVQPNILPKPVEFYTGMPVMPVTNSMSGSDHTLISIPLKVMLLADFNCQHCLLSKQCNPLNSKFYPILSRHFWSQTKVKKELKSLKRCQYGINMGFNPRFNQESTNFKSDCTGL